MVRPKLKLPGGASALDYAKAAMVRHLYVRQVLYAMRMHDPDAKFFVAPNMDNPEKGNCLWYQIVRNAQENGFCPLWAVHHHCLQVTDKQQMPNPWSLTKDDSINLYHSHGMRLHRDTRSRLLSTVYQLRDQLPMSCSLYDFTPLTSLQQLRSISDLDPVLELAFCDDLGLSTSKYLLADAKIAYAIAPGMYQQGFEESWKNRRGMRDLYGVGNESGISAPAVDGVFSTV